MSNVKVAGHKPAKAAKPALRPRDWDAVARLKAKHLKPAGRGPKGQPIYAYGDIAKLDIAYPDEKD
ncbi:MAG: hypothetical protein NTW87_10190 [Planctomycetota bacterium]|nr:hypothetical protein [Planctomycetota bacterium]